MEEGECGRKWFNVEGKREEKIHKNRDKKQIKRKATNTSVWKKGRRRIERQEGRNKSKD